MADIKQLERALVNADAAGDAGAAKAFADEIRKMRATTQEPAVNPQAARDAQAKEGVSDSAVVGALAGLGSGVGRVAMGAQHYIGKGLDAIGADKAGQWLVDDAAKGRAKLKGEVDPYKEKSPIATGGGELTGEIVATLPVGGMLAKGVRAVAPAATGFANALASGGFTTGNKLAQTASLGAKAADMGIRTLGGAGTGLAATALASPENAGMGALIGGALPVVTKVGGAVGRAIGSVTKKGGERRAIEEIAETIGQKNVRQAMADIQSYYPKGAEGIPVSSSGVTKLPDLARLEQGSRLRASPAWYDFDLKQSKAVADNVMKATDDAGELSARFADRTQNWADNWAKASGKIKPRIFAKRMGALYDDLQQAKASPEAVNGEVAGALQEIEDTVMKFGKGFTPEHLQKLRAEFNGKVKPMAKTAMKSAPRDNPAIKSLITELDDILNASTSGKWDKVRQGYAEDTTKVHAAKAAQKVRNSFIDPETGMVRKAADADGDIPRITDAGLVRAMDSARLPDKSLALSKNATQRLEATLDALRRQNIVQGVKRSASAGGGSDSVGNALALAADTGSAGGNALVRGVLNSGRRAALGRKDDAMANLLMSPDDLAIALQTYLNHANRSPNALSGTSYRASPLTIAELLASERP